MGPVGGDVPQRPGLDAARNATAYLVTLLRLPPHWATALDEWRVSPTGALDFRRTWLVEALTIFGSLSSFMIAVLAAVAGAPLGRVLAWLIASVVEAAGYVAVIRGHAKATLRTILGCALVICWLEIATRTNPPFGSITTGVSILVICAFAERTKVTLGLGVVVACSVAWAYLVGDSAAFSPRTSAAVAAGSALTTGLLAVVGSWTLTVTHRVTLELGVREALADPEVIAGMALGSSESQRQIRDELTGLYNRRYLMERMRARSTQASLLMIDVDHLAQVNDACGLRVGDLVLQRLSVIFAEHVRSADLLARMGRDEFAVLLPGTTVHEAQRLAQRLRSRVESLTWDEVALPQGQITISVGVVSWAGATSGLSSEVSQLLKAADRALYASKAAGRNAVSVAEVTIC